MGPPISRIHAEIPKKMDENKGSGLLPLCRLCGIFGHHVIDIFDENSRPGTNNASALRDNIFCCVDVRVNDNLDLCQLDGC